MDEKGISHRLGATGRWCRNSLATDFGSTEYKSLSNINIELKIMRKRNLFLVYRSVFCFSLSKSRKVCCNLSVNISRFLVNLYSASNFSDNRTRSRVASCRGTSDIYNPFLRKENKIRKIKNKLKIEEFYKN